MRKVRLLILSLALLVSLQTAASAATLLGIYYGNQGRAMSDVANMEAWQGKRH